MKRALLPILLAFPAIYVGACSAEDAPPIVGGVAGSGAGTPGTSGSGGAPVGTAGNAPVAGTGTGGASTGGSGTGGAGGISTGGASTGGGGASTGGGGSGGASGGGAGGATGGGGTGGAAETPVSVGKLDGMLITTPCGDTPTGDDCAGGGWIYEGKTTGCTGGKLDSDVPSKATLDFPITGGVPGKRYLATMHFYGMMEPKDYGPTVTREAGTMRPNAGQNPSTPEPFATADGNASIATTDYNNYEVHSYASDGTRIKQYFINSDTQQGHYTFAISYARPIEIESGGKVHVRVFDNNCRMIKNCQGGAPCAPNARTVNISAAMPQPAALMQPGLGKDAANSGQWFLIDVKDIVAKP
jgi:hypothetical protein